MKKNGGVYTDEIYMFFLHTYKKYKIHLIRRLPFKTCPVIYGQKVPDLRKLDLPSTSLQKKLGEISRQECLDSFKARLSKPNINNDEIEEFDSNPQQAADLMIEKLNPHMQATAMATNK